LSLRLKILKHELSHIIFHASMFLVVDSKRWRYEVPTAVSETEPEKLNGVSLHILCTRINKVGNENLA
jgi:hypothetical protein